jgi:cytochrome c oxidase subunit II
MSPAYSTFQSASQYNQPIVHLEIVVFSIMFGILLLISGLVIYACIRFRGRPGQPDPYQNLGNSKLELTWTLLPLFLLIGIFVITVQTMRASDPANDSQNIPPDIVIIGHQFWWEIRYPKAGFTTANEVHLPAGQKVFARIESADVIHDFWVPALGRKMDAIPGHPNSMWLDANEPGTYYGTCAEFCGAEHAWMRIRVIAQTPEQFHIWEHEQELPPAAPQTAAAQRGEELFHTRSCASCHAIAGISSADIGPNLTHLESRETLAAGRLDNTPVNLEAWIHNPNQFKPGSFMPNTGLSPDDLSSITAYLETLR